MSASPFIVRKVKLDAEERLRLGREFIQAEAKGMLTSSPLSAFFRNLLGIDFIENLERLMEAGFDQLFGIYLAGLSSDDEQRVVCLAFRRAAALGPFTEERIRACLNEVYRREFQIAQVVNRLATASQRLEDTQAEELL